MNTPDLYLMTARCQAEHFDEVISFLRSLSDFVYYCNEDTGDNNHYHFYFETKFKECTIRQRRRRGGLPKGQKAFACSHVRTTKDQCLRYMCKGFNVSSSRKNKFYDFKRNIVLAEKPKTWGIQNPEELHKMFWKEYADSCEEQGEIKKKNSNKTGTQKWLEYIGELLEIKEMPLMETQREEYQYTVSFILDEAYNYCCKIDKASVDHVVKQFVNAALNKYDDTGLYRQKKKSELMYEFI
jgi:hypothetical protein